MKIKIILSKRLLESNSGSKIKIGDPVDFEERMSDLSYELENKGYYHWVRIGQILRSYDDWINLAEGRSEFYKQTEINNSGFETQDVFSISIYDTSNIQNKSELFSGPYHGGYLLDNNTPDIQESLNMMRSSIGPGRMILIHVATTKEGKKGELVRSAGYYLSIDGNDFALFIPTEDWPDRW